MKRLPEEGFKDAAFCSMCGPKFCSMNHSVKTQEFTEADAEAVLNANLTQIANVAGDERWSGRSARNRRFSTGTAAEAKASVAG